MSYFSVGNVADCAASLGYKVVGTLDGATVGGKAYNIGPITSVFMSKLLVDHFGIEYAAPIPVGFDGSKAPKLIGAVAKQFPNVSELEGAAADREVVKAYLETERPLAKEGYEVPKYDVPAVSYTSVIETKRIGRTRTDVLRIGELPEKFYLRVAGSQDDLETMVAICQEDGIAVVMDEFCYITNIDLSGFPPLPEHLHAVHFEKDVHQRTEEKHTSAPTAGHARVPPPTDRAPPPSAPTKEEGELPLPAEWKDFIERQDLDSYGAVTASVAFARSVTSNRRNIGSHRHGWTKKVLNQWPVGSVKNVPEYIGILFNIASNNEAMAAKLMRALTTHLRIDGGMLKRVALPGQEGQ